MIRNVLTVVVLIGNLAAQAPAPSNMVHRRDCPVEFTAPQGWSIGGDRCSFVLQHQKPDGQPESFYVNVYSGKITDADGLYTSVNDTDDTVIKNVTFGAFRGIRREDPNMVVLSNGDLVVSLRGENSSLLGFLAKTLRATGKSRHGDPAHHPQLFDRACGVFADYPRDLLAKPGQQRCSVELYSAWPPPLGEGAVDITVEVVDEKFPNEFCRQEDDHFSNNEITNTKNWILIEQTAPTRVFGAAGYQGAGDRDTLIFSDRCSRSFTVESPSDELRQVLLKTLRFDPATCAEPLKSVPACE